MKKLTLIALLFLSQHSLALVDGQLLVGKKWYVNKQDTTQTNLAADVTVAAVHVDPIPLVPVALGLNMTTAQINPGDFAVKASSASISELSLELFAWIPMVPFITPYAKVTIPVDSSMVAEFPSDSGLAKVDTKLSGNDITVGFMRSLFPFVKIIFEAGQGTREAKDFFGSKQTFTSEYAAVGVQVGI